MTYDISLAYGYPDEIAVLFKEYTDYLIECEPAYSAYLDKQNYSDEVKHLEAKYGLPDGRIYIVHCSNDVVGCVAMRRLSGESCELKRLYVRPEYRGNGIAEALVRRIIDDARQCGYVNILLDTFPFLDKAITLYRKLGFYETDSYNNSPMDDLIYLKYDL